jgi:hypothetical protein
MGGNAAANLSGWKDTARMTEFLIFALSTDWFLPYWEEIGIFIAGDKKVCIQQGCRQIVDHLAGGDDTTFMLSFTEGDRHKAHSEVVSLSRKCDAEPEISSTVEEWRNLSSEELTAVVQCAGLNSLIPSVDASVDLPHLEFGIRAKVVRAWEPHKLDASVFRDVCLNSKTEWDLRMRGLLSIPRTLPNQLWRVLLNRRFRAFWADVQECLSPQQVQELVSWYRAVIKAKTHQERPDLIPSFIG